MTDLTAQKCEACRADAPRVSDEELPELMRQIPDWTPVVRDGVLQLERSYKFKNFKQYKEKAYGGKSAAGSFDS